MRVTLHDVQPLSYRVQLLDRSVFIGKNWKFDDRFSVFLQKNFGQHSKNYLKFKIHFWNDYQLFFNAEIKNLGQ